MKVTLISKTPAAAELLLFTKSTRLELSLGLLEEIDNLSQERKAEELQKMANTIRSSWEFVDLVFLVQDISRSTAQQVTRTRQASYAMQSMRVVDGMKLPNVEPYTAGTSGFRKRVWRTSVAAAYDAYETLTKDGMPREDARDVLPLGTGCNLVVKYNLRAFVDLVTARESLRAQGPYREMVAEMKRLTLAAWPWSAPFFVPANEAAINMLRQVAKDIGVTTGSGPGWEIAKAIDLLTK